MHDEVGSFVGLDLVALLWNKKTKKHIWFNWSTFWFSWLDIITFPVTEFNRILNFLFFLIITMSACTSVFEWKRTLVHGHRFTNQPQWTIIELYARINAFVMISSLLLTRFSSFFLSRTKERKCIDMKREKKKSSGVRISNENVLLNRSLLYCSFIFNTLNDGIKSYKR